MQGKDTLLFRSQEASEPNPGAPSAVKGVLFQSSSLFRKDSDHVTHGPSMPFPLSSEKAHVGSEWLQFRQGRQEYFSTLIRGTLALLSRPHHGVTAPHSAQRFSSAFERLLRIPQPILKMAKSLPGPLALIRTQGLSARLI